MLLQHNKNNLSGRFWWSIHWLRKSVPSNPEGKSDCLTGNTQNFARVIGCLIVTLSELYTVIFCPRASDKIHHLIYFYIEYLEKGRDSKTTYVQPPFYIYTYVRSECACVHLSPKKSVKNSFLFWISKLQLWGSHSNERRVPGEGTNQSGTREQPSKLRREAPLCSTAVSVPIYLVSMRSFSSPRL